MPLHPSTTEALREYADIRDRRFPVPRTDTSSSPPSGTPLIHGLVEETFNQLTTTHWDPLRDRQTPDSRPPAQLRRRAAHRLVPLRAGPGPEDGGAVHLPGPRQPGRTYWYFSAVPELMELVAERLEHGTRSMSALAPSLQAFFTERLMNQRKPASTPSPPAATRSGCCCASPARAPAPPRAAWTSRPGRAADRGVPRPPGGRTRKRRPHPQRPAGRHPIPVRVRRLRHPEHAAVDPTRVRHPTKRTDRELVTYLTETEIQALLAARTGRPGSGDEITRCWGSPGDRAAGQRTHRTDLRRGRLGAGAHLHCLGKGRKQRRTPLLPATVAVMKVWLAERAATRPTRCSLPAPEGSSAATRSNTASPSTPPTPRSTANRWRRNR